MRTDSMVVVRRTLLGLLGGLLVLPGTASAALVTSLPNSAYIQLPALNYFGPGPQSFNGVDWYSENATDQGGSVYGYTSGYGFGGNGFWDGTLGPMAGLNNSFDVWGSQDTMTFEFQTPVSIVGGFINYVPGGSTPTTIAVYDAANNLLDSYNLTFVTGNGLNLGQTLGFDVGAPVIKYFRMTGNYIGIVGQTGNDIGIPEPGALLLLGTGLLLSVGFGRRRLTR